MPPRLRKVDTLYGEMGTRILEAVRSAIAPETEILCLVGPGGGSIVRIANSTMRDALMAGETGTCQSVLRALDEAMVLDGIDIIVIERQPPDHLHATVGAGWERFWREGRSKGIPDGVADPLFRRIMNLYAVLRRWDASEDSVRSHVDRLFERALASL
jgi:hypothetical protein